MAYVVVWTVQTELADRYEYEDFYSVFDDFAGATKSYDMLRSEDFVWCAAITRVMDATEPHWLDEKEAV